MTTRTTKAKSTKKRTTLTIQIPATRLLVLEEDANRAGMNIATYLITCATEFGHNLWTRPTDQKVGGTN